jgi:NAD(P)-dependent dehydrogenase (short-subunit alcohol dehydrogenase family)
MSETKKRVCAVVGVGPGNGAAFARRFAAEGYAVALLARSTELTGALAKDRGRSRWRRDRSARLGDVRPRV